MNKQELSGYLKEIGLSMEVEQGWDGDFQPDWKHHWAQTITLKVGDNVEVFPYFKGAGLPQETSLVDFIECTASDWSCANDSETFEDFCDNFGYDSDSIKALKTFEQLKEQADRFQKLVGGYKVAHKIAQLTRED